MPQIDFINSILPGATQIQQQTGIPAAVMVAQVCLETGYGQSVIAGSFNLFNIKGTGLAGSVTVPTKEYENGQWITVKAAFRAYHNYAESFADYAALITGPGRYAPVLAARNNPDNFAQQLQACGYATDPEYATKVIWIMDHFGIAQLVAQALGSAPTPQPSGNYYVVQPGDTLSGIAAKYRTTYQNLAAINGISDPDKIYPGQRIKVTSSAQPASQHTYYVVKTGDTLSGIASHYGTTYQHLAEVNGIADPNKIYAGQKLLIR